MSHLSSLISIIMYMLAPYHAITFYLFDIYLFSLGAYHGCPYRHQSDHQLSAVLGSLQLGPEVVRDIVTIAKKGDYQVACQKHFDVTHPGHHQMDLKVGSILTLQSIN